MAAKYTKFYNAHAEPLFCSLNLLFYHAVVAVAVVVCLRSLITVTGHHFFEQATNTKSKPLYKTMGVCNNYFTKLEVAQNKRPSG